MGDPTTLWVVVVAFGLGYYLISALIDFSRRVKTQRPILSAPSATPNQEFLGHVGFMAKALAIADGPLNPSELAVITDYVNSRTTTDTALRASLLGVLSGPTKSAHAIEYHTDQCRRLKGDDPAALSELVRFLDALAACDGPVNPSESALLNAIHGRLQAP